MDICDPSAPMRSWEADRENHLEAYGLGGLRYAEQHGKEGVPYLNRIEGESLSQKLSSHLHTSA